MSMSCPACNGELVLVDTQGHYGAPMVVDRCTNCQGFWLESMSAVGVGHTATVALEGDTDLGQIATTPRSDFRGCPQCGVGLEEITGGRVPEGLHIDTCPKCRGMWFDRGELLVYKSALEAKKQAKQQERLAKERKDIFRPKTQDSYYLDGMRINALSVREAANVMTRLL